MAGNKVGIVIKLSNQERLIDAEIDMTNKHDLDNWMMGRRPLKIFIQDPIGRLPENERPYDLECRLGPNLGMSAQITFHG